MQMRASVAEFCHQAGAVGHRQLDHIADAAPGQGARAHGGRAQGFFNNPVQIGAHGSWSPWAGATVRQVVLADISQKPLRRDFDHVQDDFEAVGAAKIGVGHVGDP